MRLAIAAAGTGGHVFPALAVAETLVSGGLDREDVLFLGGDRLESTVIPEAGFEFAAFELAPLKRAFAMENLGVALTVWKAAGEMKSNIERHGSSVMLAMGGYVTGPAALAARRAAIPLLLHEQNAIPGLANRLAARLATDVAVAFPAALAQFPNARVVGNPLRPDILQPVSRSHACRHYGLDPAAPVIGVLGGSQGAEALNESVPNLIRASDEWQVLHLTGRGNLERVAGEAESHERWTPIGFETAMHFFYAASDLVIGRAGALTVSELAATGTPSVLIPYIHGTADHQSANAELLVEAGGAELLEQSELDRLPKVVRSIFDRNELETMSAAAREVGRPDAAAAVASRLLELSGG